VVRARSSCCRSCRASACRCVGSVATRSLLSDRFVFGDEFAKRSVPNGTLCVPRFWPCHLSKAPVNHLQSAPSSPRPDQRTSRTHRRRSDQLQVRTLAYLRFDSLLFSFLASPYLVLCRSFIVLSVPWPRVLCQSFAIVSPCSRSQLGCLPIWKRNNINTVCLDC